MEILILKIEGDAMGENISGKTLKVLVVDDSLLIHKLIKRIIEPEGYKVCATAVNGKQAVEMYKEYNPDIITMDINMPVMDGIEASRLIKNINPEAKIIFLGSAIDNNLIDIANEIGVRYFVDKPFEKEALLEVLNASREGKALEGLDKEARKKDISNIILPFFRAMEEVFSSMLSIKGSVEILADEKEIQDAPGYSAAIGFTGKVSGWFVLNMGTETAWKVAERINAETYESRNDAFIGYSVQELVNIICGKGIICVNNTERNLSIKMTPPGLFKSMSTAMLNYSDDSYHGVMRTEFGDINVSIIIE